MKQRAPMQWSNDRHAGFTTANNTWISPAANFHTMNVQVGYDQIVKG